MKLKHFLVVGCSPSDPWWLRQSGWPIHAAILAKGRIRSSTRRPNDEGGRYNEATKTEHFDRDSTCRIHVEKQQP